MSDIRVGVILDGSNVPAQARQIGKKAQANVGGLASPPTWAEAYNMGLPRGKNLVNLAEIAAKQQAEQRATMAAGMKTAMTNSIGAFAGRFGLSGAGTALRAGAIGAAVAGVVAALVVLRQAIRQISNAIEEARGRYARQLQSGGLPGGFTTGRTELAKIIGVSENDVLQYGAAVEFLSERMKLSITEMNRTTKQLTATSWNFKLLGLNLRAFWAQIAAAFAPFLNMVAKAMAAWVEFIREIGFGEGIAKIAALALKMLAGALILLVLPAMAGMTAIVALGDAIQYFVRQVMNSYYRITGQSEKVSDEDPFKETKAAVASMGKMLGALGRGNEEVPDAAVGRKRMQASPWERMGLVIGTGAGNNPLRQTEKNTRKTVEVLKTIAASLIPRGNNAIPKLSQAGYCAP